MNKKVAFIIDGNLKYAGRIQNQILSLRKNGLKITVFSGYKQDNSHDEKRYGVKIVNIPIRYNKHKIASFAKQLLFCFRVFIQIRRENFNFIICSKLQTLIAGALVKWENPDSYLIFDSLELSVESYNSCIKKMIWGLIQKRCLPYCDAIIHANTHRLNYFKQLHNLPDKKLYLLENYPLEKDSIFCHKKIRRQINIIYLGAVMPNRGYIELIKSFSKLDSNYRLDMVGFGNKGYVDEVKKEIKLHNVNNVRVIPPVPHDEIPELLNKYHVGLLFYENVNLNNYYCAPSKIYDYFNNGLPVISYKYPGLIDLIERNKIGVCIDEINSEELNRAIQTIIEKNYFANITPEIRKKFTWEFQEQMFLSIFSQE